MVRTWFPLCAWLVLLVSAASLFASPAANRRTNPHAKAIVEKSAKGAPLGSLTTSRTQSHKVLTAVTVDPPNGGATSDPTSGDAPTDTGVAIAEEGTPSGWSLGGVRDWWIQKIVEAKQSWIGSSHPDPAGPAGTDPSSVPDGSGHGWIGGGLGTGGNTPAGASGGGGLGPGGKTPVGASAGGGPTTSAGGNIPAGTSGGGGPSTSAGGTTPVGPSDSGGGANNGSTPPGASSGGGSGTGDSAVPATGTDPVADPGSGAVTGATSGDGYSGDTGDPGAGAADPPPPSGTRDPAYWPFLPNSPWNYPIGSNAQYVPFQWFYGPDGISDSIGIDANVAAIYVAKATDPMATFINAGWGNEAWQRRLPANAGATGGENFMTIVDEFHLSSIDLYGAARQANGSWTSGGTWNVNMRGTGVSDHWGGHMCLTPVPPLPADQNSCHGQTRASVLPAFAGAIRVGELTNGIKHAMVVIAGYDFLSLSPGGCFVWPAGGGDDGCESQYKGEKIKNLYMGGLVAIPRSVDVNSLGLALPQSVNLAKALQNYGAYVADRGDQGVFDIVVDHNAEWVPWTQDPRYRADIQKIGAACRIVRNSFNPGSGGPPRNGVKLDGGDGTLSVPLAPPFDR